MKKWSLIGLLLILTGILLQAQDPYLEGVARFKEGNLTEAGQFFSKAHETKKGNPDVLLWYAETFYLRGEYQESLQWANKANTLSTGKGEYLIARSLAMLGQADQALIHLEKHLLSGHKLPRHEILLDPAFSGMEYSEPWKTFWEKPWYSENEDLEFEVSYLRKSGDFPGALKQINAGLAERPRWGKLYSEKGITLHMMGNYQDAVRAWSVAIEISPNDPDLYLGRARSYAQLGKYKESIRDMEHASRQKPEMLDLLKELSLLCLSGKQYQDGIDYIQQYILYYPLSSKAHFIKGNIHLEAGQELKALGCFNTCLNLDPGQPEYFAARGKAYMNTDTWTYAIKDLSMALDLDPSNPETWYLKGICRQKQGDQMGAKSDFEMAAHYGSAEAHELLERMNR